MTSPSKAKGDNGQPIRRGQRRTTPVQRFWKKVDRRGPDECWPWLRSTDSAGYGLHSVNRKQEKAHRYSWTLAYGPIPDGMLVCHTCDFRLCVNPAHLWLGTPRDNNQDKLDKGRAILSCRLFCKEGHYLSPDNVRPNRPTRECLTCHRTYMAAYLKAYRRPA